MQNQLLPETKRLMRGFHGELCHRDIPHNVPRPASVVQATHDARSSTAWVSRLKARKPVILVLLDRPSSIEQEDLHAQTQRDPSSTAQTQRDPSTLELELPAAWS